MCNVVLKNLLLTEIMNNYTIIFNTCGKFEKLYDGSTLTSEYYRLNIVHDLTPISNFNFQLKNN